MATLILSIQSAVNSSNAAESADLFKTVGLAVGILSGVAGILVILVTRTWPWLKAKLDKRSIQRRVGAEDFPAAAIERSLRYYVTPFCQDIDPGGGEEPRALYGVKQNLFDALDDALTHPTEFRYLILLADSGMGKTSALLNYYARHIRSPRRGRRFDLAAIPLGGPDADKRIAAIENQGSTVLFLDALDEDTLANVDHIERVRDLLKLTRGFTRVVITCRTQFFPKDEEIPKETGILKVGSRAAGESAEYIFHKLYLSPFTDDQVKRYLRRRYPFWRRGRRRTAFEMIRKIPSLVVRPMLLAHIDDLVRAGRQINSSCDLYEEMIEAWLTREQGFIKDKESLRQFSELLAVDLYSNRQTRGGEFVPRADLAGLAATWAVPIDDWLLGSRSLLNRDAQGNYKFAHRSIMEYLCVKKFVEGPTTLDELEWTDHMSLFARELFLSSRSPNGPSAPGIDTTSWRAGRCTALIKAVLYAEERLTDPERQYRSADDGLRALKEKMLRDADGSGAAVGGSSPACIALMTLMSVYRSFNELAGAAECGEQALAAARAIEDKIGILDDLANIYEAMGQLESAIERGEHETRLLEEIGSTGASLIRSRIQLWREKLFVLGTGFKFETVTLDASGQVNLRSTREVRQFTEELAAGVVLELVRIPGDCFTMGSPRNEFLSTDAERPQHRVTTSPFHVGKFPVTQAQWRVVAGWPKVTQDIAADPSRFKGDERAVEQVSWQEAMEFCERLSQKTGETYRLPTEAEWEYACRAGTETPFGFGETITPEFVNHDGNHPYGGARKGQYRKETTPVGSLGVPNQFGLYDMHGNVWEWCQDA
jgi:formylglycine-generating enzyme required for sulfatase activity